MNEIPPRYNPKDAEDKWYAYWESKNLFAAGANPAKKPFCIVIPPPNVTGILHMGHALNNTIQDILIRYNRLKGQEALWMPGTDHAGIATQNVVEKTLAREGKRRQDLGREAFVERVWNWKEQYGSTIIRQLKKLGASCDWQRTRFTMDADYSAAVTEVFVRLYDKGLIYRGSYIINWCPRCQTALSDEEAAHRQLNSNLYYLRYPLVDSPDHIVVATTRPETMLGDTAVAVNPKDKRYKKLIGKDLNLPLVNRKIKIIADSMVDPKFGTGCVKVTPAHDPNDYLMGKKHGLEFINVMNPDGSMNEAAGNYKGLDRFAAREVILEDLRQKGLLEKIDPHVLSVGHCYRCHTIVEPYLSKQWFVRMKPLAHPAIAAVKKGEITFYPARWKKVYLNWMENIQDWCISRQIWWGHRLPVYYCRACQKQASESMVNGQWSIDKETTDAQGVIVSQVKPEKCPGCGSTDIYQDEDVLDTWFSSWLWPFATFYWPNFRGQGTGDRGQGSLNESREEKDLKYFYPTSTLVTAPEIIFFWVARMIMAGFEFMGGIPFKDVYIHGTVRDTEGKKMSKSLGNIIDPLEIISDYGTDALRFSLISITAQGQDVFLSKERFEQGRNFANKIWNASRFILMNIEPKFVPRDLCVFFAKEELSLINRWILSRFYSVLRDVEKSLAAYRFNEAATMLYTFFWHEFCDWYLELIKQDIKHPHNQLVMYKILEKYIRALHPFMPFITEEIWQRLRECVEGDKLEGVKVSGCQSVKVSECQSVMEQAWPHIQDQIIDKKAEKDAQAIFETITLIRNLRSSLDIAPDQKVNVSIFPRLKSKRALLEQNERIFKNMAKLDSLMLLPVNTRPPATISAVNADFDVYLHFSGLLDAGEERRKISLRIAEIKKYLLSKEQRLKNQEFVNKAPKEIVEKELAGLAEYKLTLSRLEKMQHELQ